VAPEAEEGEAHDPDDSKKEVPVGPPPTREGSDGPKEDHEEPEVRHHDGPADHHGDQPCRPRFAPPLRTHHDPTRQRNGAPEGIRTPGLLLRRQTLYPAELRAQEGLILQSRPWSEKAREPRPGVSSEDSAPTSVAELARRCTNTGAYGLRRRSSRMLAYVVALLEDRDPLREHPLGERASDEVDARGEGLPVCPDSSDLQIVDSRVYVRLL